MQRANIFYGLAGWVHDYLLKIELPSSGYMSVSHIHLKVMIYLLESIVYCAAWVDSVLFAFLFGVLYLKESLYPQRILGILGICLGLVLIRIN